MIKINDKLISGLCQFFRQCDNFVFLDTSMPDSGEDRSLLFVDPEERLVFLGGDEKAFLDKVQEKLKSGLYVAGWFGYEFGCLFEPGLRKLLCRGEDENAVLADLGVYKSCYSFDHQTGKTDFPVTDMLDDDEDDFEISGLVTSQTEEEYVAALRKVLDYIAAGDIYQANYTMKLYFDFHGSYESFYRALRRNQSVRYGAYIRNGEQRILSFSPEMFFRKRQEGLVARPMKGTVHRGNTLIEDEGLCKFLRNDLKNQSENVMIVDLLRNDLGRLLYGLEKGEVRVDSLFDIETYETLLQMTSTISAISSKQELASISLHQLFKALFPCGSITGAPKIRTMEIIDEVETTRRGVYTGSIGYMTPNGECVFNVPIRTVKLDGGKGEMGVGSGIVHDSDPREEWQECLLKGRFLTHPRHSFQLIETLLWLPQDGYLFFDQHMERLQESAQYFLFTCSVSDIHNQLHGLSERFSDSACRVRVLLDKDGGCHCSYEQVQGPDCIELPSSLLPEESLPKVRVSTEKTDSGSCWLYHKTTNRSLYNKEYRASCRDGFFDVLFLNERDKITEGAISNVFILHNGQYITPAVGDGLLAGVMRSRLLQQYPGIIQRSLTLDDLQRADAVFCCNSVRGVVQVRVEGGLG